jgi:hypothetical protein
MRRRVARRADDELVARRAVGDERAPAAVGADRLAVNRGPGPRAGRRVGRVDLERRADERQVGREVALAVVEAEAADGAVENDAGFGDDRQRRRRPAGDEAIGLANALALNEVSR